MLPSSCCAHGKQGVSSPASERSGSTTEQTAAPAKNFSCQTLLPLHRYQVFLLNLGHAKKCDFETEAAFSMGSLCGRTVPGGSPPSERLLRLWLSCWVFSQRRSAWGFQSDTAALYLMAALPLTISVCQVPVYRETETAGVNNTETKPRFQAASFDVCLFPKNLDSNEKPGQGRKSCYGSALSWCCWHWERFDLSMRVSL